MGNGYGLRASNGADATASGPEAPTHYAIERFVQRADALRATIDAGRVLTSSALAAAASDYAAAVRASAVAERPETARARVEAAHKRLQATRRSTHRSQLARSQRSSK